MKFKTDENLPVEEQQPAERQRPARKRYDLSAAWKAVVVPLPVVRRESLACHRQAECEE